MTLFWAAAWLLGNRRFLGKLKKTFFFLQKQRTLETKLETLKIRGADCWQVIFAAAIPHVRNEELGNL